MTENNAAHIAALEDLRLGVEMDRHHLPDGDAKIAALDAALASLRAPVADERVLPPLPHIPTSYLQLKNLDKIHGMMRNYALAALANAAATDRAMLQSVLQDLEKSESVCSRCGHSDSCADMDVAYMIRGHLKGDASAPADEPPGCPTYVCRAAQADGVLCANDECDRASGVRPASAPVAGEAPPTDWQNALRIAELPEVDEALAVFCNDGTLDNAVGLVQATLDAAPQASAVDGLPAWWERFMNELTLRSEDEVRNDLAGILEICALDAIASAAPQASEAVRIQFPAHLRKMWSGGEVQAWLDEHQGVTPPKVSAKGSLERYRKWQAEREEAFGAGVKAAADLVKKTVEDYDANHGSTDCETGTREYPGEGATWVCEMQELEESIRALSAQPAQKEQSDE